MWASIRLILPPLSIMPLYYSASSTSRISKKPRKPPPLRRATTSLFSSLPRDKPSLTRSKTNPEPPTHNATPPLDDPLPSTGRPASIAPSDPLPSLSHAIQYIKSHMFTSMPDRTTGMTSTRIAEVLNFRRTLPPVASTAHVHAILHPHNPTAAEKEVSEAISKGTVRRLKVPNRDLMPRNGGTGVGEGLVLASDWEGIVQAARDVPDELKEKLLSLLKSNPTSSTLPQSLFTPQEATTLMRAGLLTASTASTTPYNPLATSSSLPGNFSTLTSLTAISSSSPSGTVSAVGGSTAFHDLGGGGVRTSTSTTPSAEFQLSLPTMGPYLRLVTAARAQLISLLVKISPRYKEAPVSMLRERWDGGVGSEAAPVARHGSRRARGEFEGVLPGQTRKWRQYYGLRFEWLLEECVGSGVMEVFDTGSVGLGVRVC